MASKERVSAAVDDDESYRKGHRRRDAYRSWLLGRRGWMRAISITLGMMLLYVVYGSHQTQHPGTAFQDGDDELGWATGAAIKGHVADMHQDLQVNQLAPMLIANEISGDAPREPPHPIRVEHQFVQPLIEPEFEHNQHIPISTWANLKVRGALYMIVRNENLPQAREVMRDIEDRFNHKHGYPWILLNNQHFSKHFEQYARTVTKSPVYFGKIDAEAWNYPRWIDVPKAEKAIFNMLHIFKGESPSYHQLLRYQAGLFFHHPLFNHVEYTWRIDPGTHYSCNLQSDPFETMQKEGKKMGFVLSFIEEPGAIRTLWNTTQEFMRDHPQFVKPREETILPWVQPRKDGRFNMCHMWSNLEILDLSFVRSEAYSAYFNYLDARGGFFYERWGDVVRTLAAAMFLKKEDIHFFNEIGYQKEDFVHCPLERSLHQQCTCDVNRVHAIDGSSCTLTLLKMIQPDLLYTWAEYAQSRNVRTDWAYRLKMNLPKPPLKPISKPTFKLQKANAPAENLNDVGKDNGPPPIMGIDAAQAVPADEAAPTAENVAANDPEQALKGPDEPQNDAVPKKDANDADQKVGDDDKINDNVKIDDTDINVKKDVMKEEEKNANKDENKDEHKGEIMEDGVLVVATAEEADQRNDNENSKKKPLDDKKLNKNDVARKDIVQ